MNWRKDVVHAIEDLNSKEKTIQVSKYMYKKYTVN